MAKILGICNNKGGVGKTTMTLFLADFFSSMFINKKKSRVLVIDFDPQSSCASSLLGLKKVQAVKAAQKTISHLFFTTDRSHSVIDFTDYIHIREEKKPTRKTRKIPIGSLDVMLADAQSVQLFDENATIQDSILFAERIKENLGRRYDFIFVDFPGNLSKVNRFSLIGAFLVTSFIIPLEPNKMNVNAVSGTTDLLGRLTGWRGKKYYTVLGIVLNKTDRRTTQYKRHLHELVQTANITGCKIYDSILPSATKLANAADDSIEFSTLSAKYDSYYPHVRRFVKEIMRDLGFKNEKEKS